MIEDVSEGGVPLIDDPADEVDEEREAATLTMERR